MNIQYFQERHLSDVVIWFEQNGVRVSFGETPGNRHYEEYLEWVAEGNTAEVVEV